MDSPVFFLAMSFCTLVNVVAVSFSFERGTGRTNAHSTVGCAGFVAFCWITFKLDRFAAVIPEPARAAITSSRLMVMPESIYTSKTIWSACRFAKCDAETVTEVESSCPNAAKGDAS
jgi:hypothetical protein